MFLNAVPVVSEGPHDAAVAVAALRKGITDGELVASDLVKVGDDHSITLYAALAGGGLFNVLRDVLVSIAERNSVFHTHSLLIG